MMDNEVFDWDASMKRLEQIAKTVEDPSTGLTDIDALIKEAGEIVGRGREYLRSAREKTDSIE